jgi:phosphohistidine phosphatase SixA
MKTLRCFLQLTLFCLAAWAVGPASAAQSPAGELIRALRDGGYVLVMRHAHAPRQPPSANEADAGNTGGERELDAAGRESAVAMGEAMRKLGIPLGAVLSSPTFRAMQTARLARFGEPQAVEQLGDRATDGRDAWLRGKAAEAPAAGRNTILVTHAPTVTGAFGETASGMADGELLVLKPDGSGSVEVMGRIRIEEWPALVAR